MAYLKSLARPDGGYGWDDQDRSHLTPTFAAIGCYRLLGQSPPDPRGLAEFVRTHHPFRLKKLERELRDFEYQQIQSLLWLGEDASAFHDTVRGWKRPAAYPQVYEQQGNPVFRFETKAFTCRALLGLPVEDVDPSLVAYLDARRRPDGSFNNTPSAAGGGGNVLNTLWGLQALKALAREAERRTETIAWLRACQLPGGGFTHQPKAAAGGADDVAYTWAAVRALGLLGAEPADRAGCVRYLQSLANSDGGFGDRPGWPSNAVATYYALDAHAALGERVPPAAPLRAAPPRRELPPGLKVFTIQLEAHGKGSPAEAVDLAGALRISLWGAKNSPPGWIDRAQAAADRRGVPVRFFVANEEYGTWVSLPGLGTYSHTSDVLAPPRLDFGPSLAGRGVVGWDQFRELRLAPLEKAGGRLIWQFGENEELTRVYLDDSLERGGYAAISTFHFGNPDFTNSSPFLKRYRGKLPYVALQDAHGPEAWWLADMTTGFRTLFLAREATWEGWLEALRHDRVVAVRRDAVSGGQTWMHGGRPEVLDFVRRHEADWRWWDNPAIARPLVSVVAVTPEDEFEVARPAHGVMIRVRCAWENTAQGHPKRPITELVGLSIDGTDVRPTLVAPKAVKKGATGAGLADHYHQFHLPDPQPGRHTVRAVVREVRTGRLVEREIELLR